MQAHKANQARKHTKHTQHTSMQACHLADSYHLISLSVSLSHPPPPPLSIMKITNLKFDCFNKNLESDKFDWNVQFLLILQSPFGTCTE